MKQSPEQIVDELIGKAKKAQLLFEKLPQEKIDEIVTGVAWALCKPSNNEKISDQAVKDTGLGYQQLLIKDCEQHQLHENLL